MKGDVPTATIPVIVLSGVVDEMIKATVLDLGAQAFIVKPFDVMELLTILDDLFNGDMQ